jgi:alpha-mannosidase
MQKHPELTVERILRFARRFTEKIRPEKLPLTPWFAGPVDRIPFADAIRLPMRPVESRQKLGPRFATYWFRIETEVPEEWRHGPVDLIFNTGSEGLVWLDGKPLQGINYEDAPEYEDGGRIDVRLPAKAIGSGTIELFVETACNGLFGILSPEEYTFEEAALARFDQEAWDLFHDLFVPARYLAAAPDRKQLDPFRGYLLRCLNQICNEVDPDNRSTWPTARALLREVYAQRNASYTLEVSAIGHAHVDTAWLWPLAETRRKCARSFSTALAYMRRYAGYKFSCSQALQYQWMRDFYPSIYDGIQNAVREGRWFPVGGTWVEPDCNIPSGESLVRQFLYGKRFFRQEFGWECGEFWNPDVFGYSAALPQILKGVGIGYFLTQKLSWNQFNKPHHQSFLWRGIDGSEVLTHFPPADTYNAMASPGKAIADLLYHQSNFLDTDRTREGMLLFGFGDGGGGPTTHMLEILERCADFQGIPRIRQRRPAEFFARLAKDLTDPPVIEGELYFELHRGTYTSQAANKRDNRRCELLLRDAELFASLAQVQTGKGYPSEELETIWKQVLLNQFHDILPGSSIREVYEDSARAYAEILRHTEDLIERSLSRLLSPDETHLTLVNTCNWARRELIESGQLSDKQSQTSAAGTTLALVEIRSCSFAEYQPVSARDSVVAAEQGEKITLENRQLLVTLTRDGRITSIYDKLHERETVDPSSRGAQFVLFDDRPNQWEAWDVDVFHLETRQELPLAKACQISELGPLRGSVTYEFAFGGSNLTAHIRLEAESSVLIFDCQAQWAHRKKFLKAEFPLLIRATEATYEIQFGYVRRPTTVNNSFDLAKFEVCGHRWADLSESGYGVSLFTDSKYGYSTLGSVMRLSLLRGPESPDPRADLGEHRFRFALYPHAGDLAVAETVRRAHAFNNSLRLAKGYSEPLSWFETDSPNLVLESVKKAEENDAIIVRLYECHGARGAATLRTPFAHKDVHRVNLLEEEATPLKLNPDLSLTIAYRPFEIITLRFGG